MSKRHVVGKHMSRLILFHLPVHSLQSAVSQIDNLISMNHNIGVKSVNPATALYLFLPQNFASNMGLVVTILTFCSDFLLFYDLDLICAPRHKKCMETNVLFKLCLPLLLVMCAVISLQFCSMSFSDSLNQITVSII